MKTDKQVSPSSLTDTARDHFVGPVKPNHLRLVEKSEPPKPRITAAEQLEKQQEMLRAALAAKPAFDGTTQPIQHQQQPAYIPQHQMPMQQQTGGRLPPVQQQPNPPAPYTMMKPQ